MYIIDTGIGIEISIYMQTESCVNYKNKSTKCTVKHVKIGSYSVEY